MVTLDLGSVPFYWENMLKSFPLSWKVSSEVGKYRGKLESSGRSWKILDEVGKF